MVFGFNTNVRVGDSPFHIQSEDRGPASSLLETVVFLRGRVMHRRTSAYPAAAPPTEDSLSRLLEDQHRAVINDLLSGALHLQIPAVAPQRISLELLNPGSWLASGTASLKLSVRTRPGGHPVARAAIEVGLNGQNGPLSFQVLSDTAGLASLSFPMPRLAPGGAELVIRAQSEGAGDELRYQLKPRPRPVPSTLPGSSL